jgi:acyl-CoA synthetase (AMP-forming)/AMP-acid ligase II
VWVTVGSGGSSEEIAASIRSTDTEAVLFSSRYADRIERVLVAAECLKAAICLDELGPEVSLPDSELDAAVALEERPGDIVTLFNSGGTTGAPKGVMLTGQAWELLVASSSFNLRHPEPVKLLLSPITHTAGAVAFLADLVQGATHILEDGFDPGRLMSLIETQRVTYVFLPPTAVNILLGHPAVRRRDYSSLRYLVYGGAPIAPERVLEAMDVFGPVLATGFAQTETGGPVTYFSPADHVRARDEHKLERLSSCGRETPFARVEVMSDDDDLLPRGAIGEIVVRSNHLMMGYYDRDRAVDVPLTRGWYRTGDVGLKDADGFVYLLDRKREMIISRGYNVFPAEIEKVIEGVHGVQACAVVGAPDSDMGEVVRAVVQLHPGSTIDVERLLSECRSRLAPQKRPISIDVWPELPRSSAGKVLRRRVREEFWKGHQRKI